MVLLKMTQTCILNYFWGREGSLHVCLYMYLYMVYLCTHTYTLFGNRNTGINTVDVLKIQNYRFLYLGHILNLQVF